MGGACTIELVADTPSGAYGIAIDDAFVYWVEVDGVIARAPKPGGPRQVLVTGESQPQFIAVDAANVYWTVIGDGTAARPSGVRKAPKAGGQPIDLLTDPSLQAWEIAVDDAFVYWSDEGAGNALHRVFRIPKQGGAATALVMLAGDAQNDKDKITSIAVDATSLYFCDHVASAIYRKADKNDPQSALVKLAGAMTPDGIALSADDVFWTSFSDAGSDPSGLYKAPKAGGAPVTLATSLQATNAVSVFGGEVFWGAFYDGTVNRTPTSGGATTRIASGQNPVRIGVDARWVFWTNQANRSVMRAVR